MTCGARQQRSVEVYDKATWVMIAHRGLFIENIVIIKQAFLRNLVLQGEGEAYAHYAVTMLLASVISGRRWTYFYTGVPLRVISKPMNPI